MFQLNALNGAALVKLGKESEAYKALQHAQQLNPQDAGTTDLLYRLILILAQNRQKAKDYPAALSYLEEAIKLRPAEPGPHRNLAEIYILSENPERASAENREADRLASNSPK